MSNEEEDLSRAIESLKFAMDKQQNLIKELYEDREKPHSVNMTEALQPLSVTLLGKMTELAEEVSYQKGLLESVNSSLKTIVKNDDVQTNTLEEHEKRITKLENTKVIIIGMLIVIGIIITWRPKIVEFWEQTTTPAKTAKK